MANVQLPDSLLVHNYIEGDENALTILINRHQTKIFGFIYSKISDRDISNDIFQDTFIKVIKTLKSNSYNEEGKFLPCRKSLCWLYQSVYKHCHSLGYWWCGK